MTLSELYSNTDLNSHISFKFKTDKGTIHNYIDGYYSKKFTPLRFKNINILEIGVHDGLSIGLWRAWFTSANIYGLDNGMYEDWKWVNTLPNVQAHLIDAYSQEALNMFRDNFFDIIIDDGPHSLDSQKYSLQNWSKKLKVGGTLIIEDIQTPGSVDNILRVTPSNFKSSVYDLRKDKERYDDIILEFVKMYDFLPH